MDARPLQKAWKTPFKRNRDNVSALMDVDGPSSPGKWTAQMAAALVHFQVLFYSGWVKKYDALIVDYFGGGGLRNGHSNANVPPLKLSGMGTATYWSLRTVSEQRRDVKRGKKTGRFCSQDKGTLLLKSHRLKENNQTREVGTQWPEFHLRPKLREK